jgi:two-component system, sensor histidine kinase PdtaS
LNNLFKGIRQREGRQLTVEEKTCEYYREELVHITDSVADIRYFMIDIQSNGSLPGRRFNFHRGNKKLQMNSFQLNWTMGFFADQITCGRLILFLMVMLVISAIIIFFNRMRIKRKFILPNEENHLKDAFIQHLQNENKDLLDERKEHFKEMHDRVINNLQIVASLLNTQSSYLKNEDALTAIRISQQRLYAISLIHHIINQSEDFASLNVRNYTYALVEYLTDRLSSTKKFQFDIQMEEINLDLATGAPVGLILHECLTNAITHSFIKGLPGIITVRMIRDKDYFILTISDKGAGLPFAYDLYRGDTFGFRLMEGLAKQLGGQLKIENLPGVKIELRFPKPGS